MTSPAHRHEIPLAGESSASSVLLGWLSSLAVSIVQTGFRGLVYSTLGAAVGITLALTLPSQYTSAASFIAQGATASLLPSALQGLAASVGIGTAKDYSPQFYADLVTSEPVLAPALGRLYPVPAPGGVVQRSYVDIEGLQGKDRAREMDAALRHLRRRVAAQADVRTNIISISVTARYPELSCALAQALLSALDSMNISFRQEQSRELRQFFESRAADAQRELDSAETALRHFLEQNRVTQNSPLLTFEQARLTRTADLKRTVYTTVVQHYEEAKMQEARNVPVLTVLSRPFVPVRRSGPPRRFIVATGLLLGLLVAIAQHWLATRRSDTSAHRSPASS